MQLNRSAFLSFNASQGEAKPSAIDEPEPRPKPKPAPPKRPTAVYCAVGACAAMLQVAITAAATLLLFGNRNGPNSHEDPILAATEAILASSAKYQVVGADPKDGKIEIRDLSSGKIASFSVDDVKNGTFKFKNDHGEEISIEPRAAEKAHGGKPADLPEDIILYPGVPHRVISYTASDKFQDGSIEQITDDPVSRVLAAFERALLEAGYTISTKSLDEDAGSLLSEHTGPKRIMAIDATVEEGRTKIIIQYVFDADSKEPL